MINRPFSILVASSFVALLPPPEAGAQSGDAIPRDVVMTILRHVDGPGEVGVFPGNQLPGSLASRVSLPPGARVIVTLSSWNGTKVIGSAPGGPDSVRAWFASEFERRGYRPPPNMARWEVFRPADRAPSMIGYCSAGEHFTVSAVSRPSGLVEFALNIRDSNACVNRENEVPLMGSRTSSSGSFFSTLPLLYHPRDIELARQCRPPASYSGGGERSTEVLISTATGADQLIAHYGRQLDSAGWVREAPGTTALASWKRDSAGRDVRVLLSVVPGAGGPDCRAVKMTGTETRR